MNLGRKTNIWRVVLDKFPSEVVEKLKSYVYRLIDPRNGKTFYVGRGIGNRLYSHILDELGKESDEVGDKLRRIREIRLAGFDVAHVVHRHGMDPSAAKEVEAALIDAYSGLTNIMGGESSESEALCTPMKSFEGISLNQQYLSIEHY